MSEVYPSDESINIEQGKQMTQVAVIDLGPGNKGTFGPAPGTPEAECAQKAETSCDAKYNRPATRRYICVDGRLDGNETEMLESGVSPEVADAQIAGGISISEAVASYMDDPSTHKPQSEAVAEKTEAAVEDGYIVTVHGDNKKGKGGCQARVDMRGSLHFNAENADVVAPKVWAVSQGLGLDQWISQDDISTSIVNGKRAADNEALWDVTPEQSADIAVAHGAEYIELQGAHCEQSERLDLTDGAFSKVDFVRDNSIKDENGAIVSQVQAFSASFGRYAKDRFERTLRRGGTERDAALETMRVILFNAGMSKILITEDTKVGLVLPTQG